MKVNIMKGIFKLCVLIENIIIIQKGEKNSIYQKKFASLETKNVVLTDQHGDY